MAATDLIGPLPWELPYAACAALKRPKKKKLFSMYEKSSGAQVKNEASIGVPFVAAIVTVSSEQVR